MADAEFTLSNVVLLIARLNMFDPCNGQEVGQITVVYICLKYSVLTKVITMHMYTTYIFDYEMM